MIKDVENLEYNEEKNQLLLFFPNITKEKRKLMLNPDPRRFNGSSNEDPEKI